MCSAADSSRLWPVQVALRGLGDTSSWRASVTWPAVPSLSLGWEDPLEKAVATHSSTLAWRIPWTEEPGVLQSTGSQRVRHD